MNNSDSPAQANPRKLFVGNLPYSTTDQQLEELFAEYGALVEVKVIFDRMTGRSKGIAFVEFVDEESAKKAIAAVNGMEMDGRNLAVDVARPFQPRERSDRPRYDNNRGGDNNRRGGGGGGRFNDRRSSY